MRIISWNVNGIRAAAKKGFSDWIISSGADYVCIQETKAHLEQLSEDITGPGEYKGSFVSAERKGYSGVAIFNKTDCSVIFKGLSKSEKDEEGRVVGCEISKDVLLFGIYFPNGKASSERLTYKMDFYERARQFFRSLRNEGKSIIVCGDVNTAHKEIDLARPKENEKSSGFLPVERKWIDDFLSDGYIDCYRHFHPDEPEKYTWWDMKTGARSRNVGWRIDYFFCSKDLVSKLVASDIHTDIMGSDHCPISLEINL